MKTCPECESTNCYRYDEAVPAVGAGGPDLLPKLSSGLFKLPKMTPVVCGDCGLVRYYVAPETLDILKNNDRWESFAGNDADDADED